VQGGCGPNVSQKSSPDASKKSDGPILWAHPNAAMKLARRGGTARAASRRAAQSGAQVSSASGRSRLGPPALRGRSGRSATTPTTQWARHRSDRMRTNFVQLEQKGTAPDDSKLVTALYNGSLFRENTRLSPAARWMAQQLRSPSEKTN
jgi:hypothetical protein